MCDFFCYNFNFDSCIQPNSCFFSFFFVWIWIMRASHTILKQGSATMKQSRRKRKMNKDNFEVVRSSILLTRCREYYLMSHQDFNYPPHGVECAFCGGTEEPRKGSWEKRKQSVCIRLSGFQVVEVYGFTVAWERNLFCLSKNYLFSCADVEFRRKIVALL